MSTIEEIEKSISNINGEINLLEKEIENLEEFKIENRNAKKEVSDEMCRRVQVGSQLRCFSKRAQYADSLAQRIEDSYGSSSSELLLQNFDDIEQNINTRIEYIKQEICKKSSEMITLEESSLQAKE